MTYVPQIYDWRDDVVPLDQFFRAGGASVAGGMTLGGASVESPEPGGRAELLLSFSRLALASANLSASWTLSRLMNGAVFRVRLWYPSVQLLADADRLGAVASGVTWSNALPWSNGQTWRANPSVAVTVGASKGNTTFTCNMNTGTVNLGRVLQIGHVIGFHLGGYDFAHIVTDVQYNQSDFKAVVTVQPPLRRDLTTSDRVNFRPAMLVTATNARDVADTFRWGQTVQMNPIKFVEALV